MSVHHVEVHPVGAGRVDGPDFVAEFRHIGREDGRGDEQGAGHRCLMIRETFA